MKRSTLAASLLALAPAALSAQVMGTAFEEDRAYFADGTVYEPFVVEDHHVRPLREALADGTVESFTRLMVFERNAKPLALVLDQQAYHHFAQGWIEDEPWAVSF